MAAVTPASLSPASPLAGFTLLEMLLVLAIIAVISGLAMLGVSGNTIRVLEQESDTMVQSLQFAADSAVLQNVQIGVVMRADSYGFFKYDPQTATWYPFGEKPLLDHFLPAGFQLTLKLEKDFALPGGQDETQLKPQLVFLSSGEMSAFDIALSAQGVENPVVISSDGVSGITLTGVR